MNAADIQQRKHELDVAARRQREADVKAVMLTPAGQRFVSGIIWGELRRASINVLAEHPEFTLTVIAARKTVAEELENEVQRIAPIEYRQMNDERIKAENTEAATLRALTVPGAGDR